MNDKISILIADDNVEFAKTLTNYLKRRMYGGSWNC